jgi:carboxyl-terminal processing protease
MDSSVVIGGGRIRGSAAGTGRRGRLGGLLIVFFVLWSGHSLALEKVFGGVGLQVVPTVKGELVVLKVVSGAPAATGGLLPGDLIVEVDDFPLEGSDFSDVVSRYLWGEAGTPVTLKYLRPGQTGLHAVTLRRVPLSPEASRTPGVKMLTPETQ